MDTYDHSTVEAFVGAVATTIAFMDMTPSQGEPIRKRFIKDFEGLFEGPMEYGVQPLLSKDQRLALVALRETLLSKLASFP